MKSKKFLCENGTLLPLLRSFQFGKITISSVSAQGLKTKKNSRSTVGIILIVDEFDKNPMVVSVTLSVQSSCMTLI